MPVRKVITRRSNHFRAYIPSLKNGHPTQCESMLEGKFIRLCELSPMVRSYEVQPSFELISVGGCPERYVPDVRIRFVDGTEGWFEVKPDVRLKSERVARRLAAAAVHFAQSGRRFRVVTDKQLDMEPRASNVLEVMYQRRALLTSIELERFRHKLKSESPQTMSDFTSLVGPGDAWRLLGLGIVGVDLDQPIAPDAAIYLEGGHRHADLFA
ncbi:Tn7 transposase TnsA N-terminal domain-containing protein [Ralstonia solanacearum]|uniref:Tn7 transposase TnsA N-terminal domain-containing protein n=1 Tax=Ralstonia solanacearum TaxID=305 RepID=UPI001E29D881|nr:Tn7 transposase TnsA N-terminal domain-containing protein [Ralstonia solanacearum]